MITEDEYQELKARCARYDTWVDTFRGKNGWAAIPTDAYATLPDDSRISNEERSALEVYEFLHDPPEKYLLYIDERGKAAVTWMGDTLGSVWFGKEYKSNLGDRRVSIRCDAINGCRYHGTYYKGTGDYARVKRCKSK